MYFSIGGFEQKWGGWKLILPAVSIGNVGQLAMDLLITTLGMEKVGYIYHESLQSLCGNHALSTSTRNEGDLTIGTEVFQSADHKIVCVQQRVLFVKGKQAAFRRDLRDWIKSSGFSSVVVLTSSGSHERIDCQLSGNPFRFLTTPALDKQLTVSLEESLSWKRLEKRDDHWSGYHDNQSEVPEEARGVFIPGGGLASRLFGECCKDDLPVAVLLVFCSEGDNIPDAIHLMKHLNQWLKLVEEKPGDRTWKFPSSWSLLFGRDVDPTIY